MRLANLRDRLTLLLPNGRAIDVASASDGAFDLDIQRVYQRWDEFCAWAAHATAYAGLVEFESVDLGSPVPAPRQIVAFGLNYFDHATETGLEPRPGLPLVFTKFPSAVAPPYTRVTLPYNGNTDWEVELVAVIGRETYQIRPEDAWGHIAGLTIGQDISERVTQMSGPPPAQFSLGKSFPRFAPIGPWLVTVDEFANPDDLAIECTLNGEPVQSARTSDMLVPVPDLIARLSAVMILHPGDAVFTGTPPGVGMGRQPPRWLQPGDVLVSRIEGIGEIRQDFA